MDFVIIANPWEQGKDNPTSKHHLSGALIAAGHRILWINGTGMRTPSVTSRTDWGRGLDKIADALRGTERADTPTGGGKGALHVMSPVVLPLPGSRIARQINAWIYLRMAERAMKRLGFGATVLVNFLPILPDVIRGWRGCTIYYCVDRWTRLTCTIPA